MHSKKIINFVILFLAIALLIETAYADVQIAAHQTVFAQTKGDTTYRKGTKPRSTAEVVNAVKMPALPNASKNTAPTTASKPATASEIVNSAASKPTATTAGGAKKAGTIRIGVPLVKTGAVGEGISAADLAGAVQNTLQTYLKGTKIELIPLEARLASAQSNEITEKQCDFVLYATVAHKKGGGGFGKMLGSVAPVMGMMIPGAGLVGAIAGSAASTAISTAANASANVKPKDEITLDLKINRVGDNAAAFAKQYKGKAKQGGEDIISPMIEQAAQEILDQLAK